MSSEQLGDKALAWMRAEKVARRNSVRKKKLSDTDVLPPVDPGSLDDESESVPKKTRRLRKPRLEGLNLTRSRLLALEFVGSGAIAAAPSPHVRPDLIGRTIAGGRRVKGATTTADIGLRSNPSGFANYGNIRREKKKRKRKR